MRKPTLFGVFVLVVVAAWVLVLRLVDSTPGGDRLSAEEIRQIVEAPSLHAYTAVGKTGSRYAGKVVSSDVRVSHGKPNRHRIEYLTPPLDGVVIVDDGAEVWRSDPKLGATVMMDSGGCLETDNRLDLLVGNYSITRTGKDRVADRLVTALNVEAKSGNVIRRLWVDEETLIILKSESYDTHGSLVSTTEFTHISYADEPADSLFTRPSGEAVSCMEACSKPMTQDELSRRVGFQVRTPRYLPQGYKVDGFRLYECPCTCAHSSAYMKYTNGLSSISVFQIRSDSGCTTESKCDMSGGCIRQKGTAVFSHEGITSIVIADLKPDELRKIAESVR